MPAAFLYYIASRFCAGTAMMMLRAAVAWHVFELSHSAFQLGLLGLVQFAPALTLTLVGGAVADSYDRRRVMMTAQAVALAAGACVFVVTARGAVSLAHLYAVVVVAAAAMAFDNPSRAALLPQLGPVEFFPRAVTIASTNQALAFMTGPALAGMLISTAGIEATYAVYALLVLVSIVALARVRPGYAPRDPRRAMSMRAVKEGLRFLRSRQVLLGCMTLDMFAVIFGGATALLPIYAKEILHVGPRGYGLLSSSLELGALLSSIALMVLPPVKHAGRALLTAVAFYGMATIVFGLARSFPLALVAYMCVGVADQVSVVMRHTAIQLATPDELRGRVSAVSFIFISASNQLGAAESGFVAALTSAPFAVVSGGVGCLLVLVWVTWRMPELRRYTVGAAATRS